MFVAGDGLGWIYESTPWSSKRAAEHHACLELLAFLLVVGPHAVHLHPSTMANADALRAAAVAVRREFLARPPAAPRGFAWTCALVPEGLTEAWRPPPHHRAAGWYQPLAGGETCSGVVVPARTHVATSTCVLYGLPVWPHESVSSA